MKAVRKFLFYFCKTVYIYQHAILIIGASQMALSGKEFTCQCRRRQERWVRKTTWRRKWQPTPVFLLKKLHGQRRLVGYSPWGRKESDTTE